MVGHSNHQPLTIVQHAHFDDRRSMVGHSNHQPLTIEQHSHSDDRWDLFLSGYLIADSHRTSFGFGDT